MVNSARSSPFFLKPDSLLAGVLVQLVGTAVSDVVSASVAIVTLVVAVRTRVNPAWLIGAGAVVGALRALAR